MRAHITTAESKVGPARAGSHDNYLLQMNIYLRFVVFLGITGKTRRRGLHATQNAKNVWYAIFGRVVRTTAKCCAKKSNPVSTPDPGSVGVRGCTTVSLRRTCRCCPSSIFGCRLWCLTGRPTKLADSPWN